MTLVNSNTNFILKVQILTSIWGYHQLGAFRGFYAWAEGQLPPNFIFAPKCDIEHCLMNSKHWHIGAKRCIVRPSKFASMHFQLGLRLGPRWVAHDDPLVDWGENTPHHIPSHNSPAFGTRHLEPWFGGGIVPKYFLSRSAPEWIEENFPSVTTVAHTKFFSQLGINIQNVELQQTCLVLIITIFVVGYFSLTLVSS